MIAAAWTTVSAGLVGVSLGVSMAKAYGVTMSDVLDSLRGMTT